MWNTITQGFASELKDTHGVKYILRKKRQISPWVWGANDNKERFSTIPPTIATTTQAAPHPCDPFKSQKPDFRVPGRRISETITQGFASELKDTHGVKYILRKKRQISPWVWGANDNKERFSTIPPTIATTTQAAPHPCDPFKSQKPDFRVPGRRISETKCFEYVWEMKNRQDNETHEIACTQWRSQFFGRRFVIQGRDTDPGEFPHMGALGWRAVEGTWIFKCGSTLISPNFLVTAAHCSILARDDTVASPRPEIVRLGDKNIIDKSFNGLDPVDVKIFRIIVHPQFVPPKKYFDIALVELAKNVVFTKYVQPACLWNQYDTTPLGTQATVTGWGVIDSARRATSPELQAAVVDIIDQNQCQALLQPTWTRLFRGLQDHQLCAGKLAGGVDACQGDSGGPLQVKINLPITTQGSLHHLIGVTSFGLGCARANTPGIYTRVSSFIDWIEDTVWGGQRLSNIFQG